MGSIPEWEVNQRVQLVPHVAAVRETFKVDHENRRQGPEVKLLGGLLMLLAVWAVPDPTGNNSFRWRAKATS